MGHSENPQAVFRANEFDASYGLSVVRFNFYFCRLVLFLYCDEIK